MSNTTEKLTKTMDTLDTTLVSILNEVTSGVGTAKDFLVEQTPQVVQEIITWYGVYNFIEFLLGIAVFAFIVIAGRKTLLKKNAPNWAFDKNDIAYADPRAAVPVCIGIVLAIWASHLVNLQWLKIWIAPKLWLIEYTAELVK
jgi:hypothetical protein